MPGTPNWSVRKTRPLGWEVRRLLELQPSAVVFVKRWAVTHCGDTKSKQVTYVSWTVHTRLVFPLFHSRTVFPFSSVFLLFVGFDFLHTLFTLPHTFLLLVFQGNNSEWADVRGNEEHNHSPGLFHAPNVGLPKSHPIRWLSHGFLTLFNLCTDTVCLRFPLDSVILSSLWYLPFPSCRSTRRRSLRRFGPGKRGRAVACWHFILKKTLFLFAV